MSNIIALLGNRKEFSTRIRQRQEGFNARYPALINGLTIVGILGLVVLGMISTLTSASKPVLLGIVAIWGLLIMGTLVGVAVLKSSLERAEGLSHLTEDELFESLARKREASMAKPKNQPESPNSRKSGSHSEPIPITASVKADTEDQTIEQLACETDASASSEERR